VRRRDAQLEGQAIDQQHRRGRDRHDEGRLEEEVQPPHPEVPAAEAPEDAEDLFGHEGDCNSLRAGGGRVDTEPDSIHTLPEREMGKTSFIRSAGLVSACTLLSRVLGFVRDMLCARYFGASLLWDAFSVAFRSRTSSAASSARAR
jgi:hypothetical protein